MFFSIGGFELLAIVAFAIPATFLRLRGYPVSRWFIAAALCVTAAACMTPADLLSTTVLAIAFLAAFAFGLRSGSVSRSVAN